MASDGCTVLVKTFGLACTLAERNRVVSKESRERAMGKRNPQPLLRILVPKGSGHEVLEDMPRHAKMRLKNWWDTLLYRDVGSFFSCRSDMVQTFAELMEAAPAGALRLISCELSIH